MHGSGSAWGVKVPDEPTKQSSRASSWRLRSVTAVPPILRHGTVVYRVSQGPALYQGPGPAELVPGVSVRSRSGHRNRPLRYSTAKGGGQTPAPHDVSASRDDPRDDASA